MTQSSNLGAVPTGTGATVRAGFNTGFQALASNNEGGSAPSPTYPFMQWRNASAAQLKRRNGINSGWEITENYGASTDPGTGDDSTVGYIRGSLWINTSTNKIFWCLDPSAAAAKWLQLGVPSFKNTQILTVNVNNTAAATTLASWTLPANTFTADGDCIDFECFGLVTQNNGADAGAVVRLRIGSTNICADQMAGIATNVSVAHPYSIKGRIWRHSSTAAKASLEVAVHGSTVTAPTTGRGDLAVAQAVTVRGMMSAGAGVSATWTADTTFTIDWAINIANAANILVAEYFKAAVPA